MAYAKELELKPCPFCGGHVQYIWDASGSVNFIYCRTCRMTVKFTGDEMALREREPFDAQMMRWAEKWNRRTT